MSHRHLEEDELLDSLLTTGALPEPAQGCAHCAAAAGELGDFLARVRAAAHAPAAADDRELVARVLARTTREDLAWRGDVSLFAEFVRQRLAASRLLRVAAASLLAHLLALPVFAWLALRPAPPAGGFRAHLELRERALPAAHEEPERELDLPALPEPHLVEAPSDGPALRRRQERAWLLASPAPELPAPSAGRVDGVAQLLHLRAAHLRDPRRAGPGWLDAAPEPTTPLERVLWAELLMDHLVLAGERSPALAAGLAGVGAAPAAPAERRLEVLTLERAEGLGLLDAAGLERLGGLAPARPTGAGERVGARGFGRALAGALGERAGGWADWDR